MQGSKDEPRHQEEEARDDGTDGESGDCHMTPAARGAISQNYYTALEEYEEEAGTRGSSEGPSEAPSIKSPFKPKKKGHGGMQAKTLTGNMKT